MNFKRRLFSVPFLLFFPLLYALLLLSPRLSAQDGGASSTGGATIQATLDLVSWGEDLTGVEIGENNKRKSVSALAFRYSEPAKYNGPQILAIYWNPTGPAAAPAPAAPAGEAEALPAELLKRREKEPTLAALVPLIAGASQMTVLLAPGPQKTFHCYVFDDEPTRFPWGKIRMHNYATGPVGLKLNNGKMIQLKREDSLIAPAGADGSVVYELAYPKDGKWKTQENNILRAGPDEQLHFIVLESDASFFRSSDGSRGGKLQTVTLRRHKPGTAGAPK